MSQEEYVVPEWKKWSSVYCSRCYKWLANYKGWHKTFLIATELYCRKCSEAIEKEQQTKDRNCLT